MTAGASTDTGIDRRTMIRRAAAAGAVAWTAPVIIGSLSSPAAALTFEGCVILTFNGGACNRNCTNAVAGVCGGNQIIACPEDLCSEFEDLCVTVSGDCQEGPATVSTTVGCGSCEIQGAIARVQGPAGDGCPPCIIGNPFAGDEHHVPSEQHSRNRHQTNRLQVQPAHRQGRLHRGLNVERI